VIILFTTKLDGKKFYVLSTECIDVFFTDLRADIISVHLEVVGFNNRKAVCLLLGTN